MPGQTRCPKCQGTMRTHSVEYPTCYQCGWVDYSKKPIMDLPTTQDVEGLGGVPKQRVDSRPSYHKRYVHH